MEDKKKIYFFDTQQDWERFKEKKNPKKDILLGHIETQEAVKNGQRVIYTFDLLSFNVGLFERKYRVFLKQKDYQMIEIKFGTNNWNNIKINFKSNLLKMYQKGQMTLFLRKI